MIRLANETTISLLTGFWSGHIECGWVLVSAEWHVDFFFRCCDPVVLWINVEGVGY